MSRTRIIKDIETLDQAIKAEEDVESGYHAVIDENITYWKAVEEDIVESYTKLIASSENLQLKQTLEHIVEDSKKHRRLLDQVSALLKEIVIDEEKHAKMLTNLKTKLETSVNNRRPLQ